MNIFVQFKCALGETYSIAEWISDKVPETGFVYSTSGAFDLIALFHLSDDIDPGVFVNETLHKVPGVQASYTIIGFNAFTPRGSLSAAHPGKSTPADQK